MYKDYSKGVAIFIFNEDEILLTKRIKGQLTGYWEVPAGHVKTGEDPTETAIREAKEETDLEIISLEKFGENINKEYKFCATLLRVDAFTGVAKNVDTYNHSHLEWFKLDNLPTPLGSSTLKGLKILNLI